MSHCGSSTFWSSKTNPTLPELYIYLDLTVSSSDRFQKNWLTTGWNSKKETAILEVDKYTSNSREISVCLCLCSYSWDIPQAHSDVDQIQIIPQRSYPLLDTSDYLHLEPRYFAHCATTVLWACSQIFQRHRCPKSARKLLLSLPIPWRALFSIASLLPPTCGAKGRKQR